MFKAFFFDMDGVLFDSMPNHATAWETVMTRHGLRFTRQDAFRQEGRTGQSVIAEAAIAAGISLSEEEVWEIYRQKSECFHNLGEARPMRGIHEVLNYLKHDMPHAEEPQIWIVTGSGQHTLFERLDHEFPGVFARQRMITAYDVEYGKPNPEPYLKAWERSGLRKEDCCVIENAPMGVRAGHAAGLYTIGVNTGPLSIDELRVEGADLVLNDMYELLNWLKNHE